MFSLKDLDQLSEIPKFLKLYVSEAEFFGKVLESDLSKLSKDCHLVEVGSGIGLLALNTAAKGREVTAFEPEASGFTEMHKMRDLITSHWSGQLPQISFRDESISESTQISRQAEYVFAINVIEHVPDYLTLIKNTVNLKTSKGVFRIICPNYSIPYEPHFEIPIIFTKKITWKLLKTRILKSEILNPEEFWSDLSWPTQRRLKRQLRASGLSAKFSRDATNAYVDRALNDPGFVKRKGPFFGTVIKTFAVIAKRLVRLIPVSMLPIIDCRITGSAE